MLADHDIPGKRLAMSSRDVREEEHYQPEYDDHCTDQYNQFSKRRDSVQLSDLPCDSSAEQSELGLGLIAK